MNLEKPLPKIVLKFYKLFEKMLDHKDKLSDWREFRNKLLKASHKKGEGK